MSKTEKTLRLVMPQWQGGGNPTYILGSRLLAWLAPESDAIVREVSVESPDEATLTLENGVIARSAILRQYQDALDIIHEVEPARIVTFGGDCSVSLAPFSYLASRYAGDVAILWIDSHTDFSSPEGYPYAHGYPAQNILGFGDPEFVAFVNDPVPANRLAYVGIQKDIFPGQGVAMFDKMGVRIFDPSELTADFTEVREWVKQTGASKLLVHFDVDALNPIGFRSQLFNNPQGLEPRFSNLATGEMSLEQVTSLLLNVGSISDIVALSITEHLPWDAENMRKALARLPIMS